MNYTTPKPLCENKNPDDLCAQYATWACESHKGFMTEWCKKACGFC